MIFERTLGNQSACKDSRFVFKIGKFNNALPIYTPSQSGLLYDTWPIKKAPLLLLGERPSQKPILKYVKIGYW
jgi:hypothetical protein